MVLFSLIGDYQGPSLSTSIVCVCVSVCVRVCVESIPAKGKDNHSIACCALHL
jgi:hypothetical protein